MIDRGDLEERKEEVTVPFSAFELDDDVPSEETAHRYLPQHMAGDIVNTIASLGLGAGLSYLQFAYPQFNVGISLLTAILSQSCAGASLKNMMLINIPAGFGMMAGGGISTLYQSMSAASRYPLSMATCLGSYGFFRAIAQRTVDQNRVDEPHELRQGVNRVSIIRSV